MDFIISMRSRIFSLLILCSFYSYSQVFNNYYTTSTSALTGTIGVETPDGGFLLGGTTTNGQDIHLTKTNTEGQVQWTNRYDLNKASYGEYITGITMLEASRGFLIVGTTINIDLPSRSDAFVMKLDVNGNRIWVKGFSSTDNMGSFDRGIKAEELSDKSIVVSLDVQGDAGILRLNENGDFLNATPSSNWKIVNAGGCCPIAFDASEKLNGGVLNANGDHYVIVGDVKASTTYYYYLLDFNLLPATSAPTVSFGKLIGGSSEMKSLTSIARFPDGSYVACGYTEANAEGGLGDKDGVVMKLSNTGVVLWAKKIGSTAGDSLSKVIYDANTQKIVCTGITRSLSGTNRGIGIIVDPETGNITLQTSLENSSVISDINVATGGKYIVTGTNGSSMQAYIASNSNLSNSVCPAVSPNLLVKDIIDIFTPSNSRDIGTPIGSPFALNDEINHYSATTAPIITDLRSVISTTNNLPDFGLSTVYPTSVCQSNGIAQFFASSIGDNISYQWLENGVELTNGGVYSRVNSSVLNITNPGASLNGRSYSLRATASLSCGSITTNSATLTVIPPSTDLAAGTIGTSQNLCAPVIPAPLTEVSAASGGACTSNYAYEFEKSEDDGVTWKKINSRNLATWDFAGNGANSNVAADYKNPEISTAVIGLGQGFGAVDFFPNSFAANQQTVRTLSEAITGNDYISITITPVAGEVLNINALKFRPVSQNRNRTFALYSSINGSAPTFIDSREIISDLSSALVTIPVPGHTNISGSVEFRIYIYGYTDFFEAVGFGNRSSSIDQPDFVIVGSGTRVFAPSSLSVTTLYRRKVFCLCDSVVSPSVKINIGSKPTTIAGSNSPVCEGDTLKLTSSAGTGTTVVYKWGGSNEFISDQQNPIISNATLAAAGTYWAVLRVDDCESDTIKITVSIKPKPTTTADNKSPICVGSTLNFSTSSGIGTYSWTGPNGFLNASQNPSIENVTVAASGIYKVTLTNDNCTSDTSEANIVVNPLPQISVRTENPTTCDAKGSAIITVTNGAGSYDVDLNGDGTYERLAQTLNGGEIVINGLDNNTNVKNVRILSTSTGCASEPFLIDNIIVVPGSPINTTSETSMCADQVSSRDLTTSTPGGTWTLDPTSTAGVGTVDNSTAKFTVNNITGTAIIVYSLNGCQDTKTITVNAVPTTTTSGGGAICEGSDLTLSATGTGNFQWNGPNGYSVFGQPQLISGITTSQAGTYSVTLESNGCTSRESQVIVVVDTLPQISLVTAEDPTNCNGTGTATITLTKPGTYFVSLHGDGTYETSPRTSDAAGRIIITGLTNNTVVRNVKVKAATTTACESAPHLIDETIVIPGAPINTTDNSAICADGTAIKSLTTETPGGTWTLGTESTDGIGTVDNATATFTVGTVPGTAIIVYTLNGCETPTTIAVNARPTTTAAGGGAFCVGSTVNLSANGPETGLFTWSGPNNYSVTGQAQVINDITASLEGDYSVVLNSNNCISLPSTVTVIVKALPEISVTTTHPTTCGGTGTATITINNLEEKFDIDLNGDNTYETEYLSQGPATSGQLVLSDLQNSTVVKDVKVRSVTTGCESAIFPINDTIKAPGAPNNSTDASSMCGDGLTSRPLVSTTTGGNWSLDPQSTPGVGVVDDVAKTFTANKIDGIAIIVYSSNGCSTPVNIAVTAQAAVTEVKSNSPICSGSSLLLEATGPETAKYKWSGPDNYSSNLQKPVIPRAEVIHDGVYTVEVTGIGCGSGAVSVEVEVIPTPTVVASNNGTLCETGNLELKAIGTPGIEYNWSGPNGYQSSGQDQIIVGASSDAEGRYTVIAKDRQCISSPSNTIVSIVKFPEIVVSVLGSCGGDGSATILVENSDKGEYRIDLNGDGTYERRSVPDVNGKIVINRLPLGAVVKDVRVQSLTTTCESAKNEIDTTITNGGAIPAPITKDTVVCLGAPKLVFEATTISGASLKWFNFAEAPLALTPSLATDKEASVTYYASQILNGCESAKSKIVGQVLSVKVDAGEEKFIRPGEDTKLSATSNGEYRYLWSPATHLDDANKLQPTAKPTESRQYTITAYSKEGCINSSSVMVNIVNDLVVPNAFSPNGDNLNDRWVIDRIENFPDAEVSIYNRWGALLKSIKNYSTNEWDGTVNGSPLPVGTYYYIINKGDGSDNEQNTITIIR